MATIQEITSGASYRGDANLGGFVPTAINIDTKPLQTLAAYAVMENKAQYDQRQIDTDAKIKELAELSRFDIVNARGKDKIEAEKMWVKLQEEMKNYAMGGVPRSPQQKLQQELEVKSKTAEAITKIKAFTARGISYDKRINDINTTYSDPTVRDLKKKQLDEEFEKGDWNTPLASEEKFEAVLPKIGNAKTVTSVANKDVGNKRIKQTLTFVHPKATMDESEAEALGFKSFSTLPPNATEAEKRNFELNQIAGKDLKIFNDATKLFNDALTSDKYKDENGDIDYQLIVQDNPLLAPFITGIDEYKEYSDNLKADIQKGIFKTKLGGKEVDLGEVIKEKDVFVIDKNKPLRLADLIFIDKFKRRNVTTEEEEVTQTNEQLAKDDNARAWFTARKAAAGGGSSGGGNVPSYIKDPAILMKKHMENVLNKFKNDPNALSGGSFAVNITSVDGSTKKALGIEPTAKDKVVVYYKNGSIRVVDGQLQKDGKILNADDKKEVDLSASSQLFTLGDLKTGYISVVKAGTPEASQTEGFQKSAEAFFDADLGTNNMQFLYDEAYKEIVGGATPATPPTTTPNKSNKQIKGFDANGNPIY
jgi:hypothetical protein